MHTWEVPRSEQEAFLAPSAASWAAIALAGIALDHPKPSSTTPDLHIYLLECCPRWPPATVTSSEIHFVFGYAMQLRGTQAYFCCKLGAPLLGFNSDSKSCWAQAVPPTRGMVAPALAI